MKNEQSDVGKKIKLPHGKFALVDDEDFEAVNSHRWCVSQRGYAYRQSVKYPPTSELMHRAILKAPKGLVVDHINKDKLDNRRKNLRLCTQRQNIWNSALRRDNKSGYQGVHWNKKDRKWRAALNIYGKIVYLGSFSDPKEASEVYNERRRALQGEFFPIKSKVTQSA